MIRTILSSTTLLILFTYSHAVHAVDELLVPEKSHTVFGLYLTPEEAYKMKTANPDSVLFIDIRTPAEVKFLGMTDSADANIPIRFMRKDYAWSDKKNTYRTRINKNFVKAVTTLLASKGLDKKSPVILMCLAGGRAPRAAKKLHDSGFVSVYSQYQGFEGSKASTGPDTGKRTVNGWKNASLPWSYKLDKSKMYFNFVK